MHFYAAVSPSLPLPNLLSLSSSCSSEKPLRARLISAFRWGVRQRSGVTWSSISQVYSYKTLDYERRSVLKWNTLFRKISMMDIHRPGSSQLEQWESEKRTLSKWELCRIIKELRKHGRFKRALEIYDWMTSQGDRFTLDCSDMAIQLDLIAKVHGIAHAEEYFHKLPDMWKEKRTYGALLNSYAQAKMKEKAESILEAMKDEGCANHTLTFNTIMTLYLNLKDHDKVYALINEMKENNVCFDTYSYNIWITNCAALGDVQGMERVVQELIADSRVNTNWTVYTTLSTMYVRLGDKEKAQSYLKDAELRINGRDRTPFNYLLGLYSSIGDKNELYRVWQRYKSNFRGILNAGYKSMLSSLVKLGDIEGAERIYEEWLYRTSNLDPKVSNVIICCYIKEGRVDDARVILNRMIGKGGKPNPMSWQFLAEGYLKVKRISEALSCLENAASYEDLGMWRPKLTTVENILNLCTEHDEKETLQTLVNVLRRTGCLEKEEYKSLISLKARLSLPSVINNL